MKSLEQIINLFHIKFRHLQQFRPNRTRDLIIYVHLQLDGSLLTPVTTDKASLLTLYLQILKSEDDICLLVYDQSRRLRTQTGNDHKLKSQGGSLALLSIHRPFNMSRGANKKTDLLGLQPLSATCTTLNL